ncbi:Fur family transcriptional regulator [Dehalobacter restrictus]|jgi:Fur family ferric uptake transcriptional regulator|uniref:Fur family transcriptional regulator n=1 Tax=Dehalobacter restrictus TaxID=55583 RepID=UPI00338EB9C2
MTKNSEFGDDLKRSGLKNTKQRAAILEILEQNDQPMAAEQVFLELKNKDMLVNLSTVYRTLETLTDINLATKLDIAGEHRMLFEYNQKVHGHHLVCLQCKKILKIHRCPLKSYEETLERETYFKISGHKLVVYGLCLQCQKNIE